MKGELALKHKKLRGFVVIVLLTLVLILLFLKTRTFEELENRSWDWRLRRVAKETIADPRIKIIGIDQSSLDYLANEEAISWPWPRALYVPIIEFLRNAGAKGIAFDIMFTEFSAFGEDDDLLLAQSLAGDMPVVMAAALRSSPGRVAIAEERLNSFKNKQLASQAQTNFSQKFPLNRKINAQSITLPIIRFIESAHSIGNVSIPNDSDGIFRHFVAGQEVLGVPILSLPFALYNAANPKSEAYHPPLNSKEQMTVKFAGGTGSYKTYSFSSILNSFKQLEEGKSPSIDPNEFKNSYVFIGMNAPGLLDLRPTPLDAKCPGVEVNATVLDNLLNKNFIREASTLENLLYSLIITMLVVGTALFVQQIRMQITIVILTFTCLFLSSYCFALYGIWFQLIVPTITSTFALASSLGLQYRLEGSQTRFIKKAFRYYVSPEVIEQIIENPSDLSLGGERREVSIFFCDIAGFTSISESLDPAVLVNFLNQFLTAMTTVILANKGTVDKYVGDAIIAFWNAPLPDSLHESRAVSAAIECQNKLEEIRQSLFEQFGHNIRMRVGLHTGIASVGNFGSLERFNYTVIGDSANLASRLEGANKIFGTEILMSEDTYNKVKENVPCLRIALIKVVGKDKPIAVYSPNKDLNSEQLAIWNQMISFFENSNFDQALELLNKIPDIKLKNFYIERIQKAKTYNGDWTPILSLTEK